MDGNSSDYEANFVQQIKEQTKRDLMQQKQTKKPLSKPKFLLIFLGVVMLSIILTLIYFRFFNTKKIACESDKGSITLTFNNNEILEVKTLDLSFDKDAQNALFKSMGKENYLNEFEAWYKDSTGLNCKRY